MRRRIVTFLVLLSLFVLSLNVVSAETVTTENASTQSLEAGDISLQGFQSCPSCGQYTYVYTECGGTGDGMGGYMPCYTRYHDSNNCTYTEQHAANRDVCASCGYVVRRYGDHIEFELHYGSCGSGVLKELCPYN